MFGVSLKQNLVSTGNETFDKFLGGGLLNTSLNLFERQGPSSRILDHVFNKSIAAATLSSKDNLIVVNFNPAVRLTNDKFIESLPVFRKVKSEILYKDVRRRAAQAKIKIAWRYSNRTHSPSDSAARSSQVDFGLSLAKDNGSSELGECLIMNVDDANFTLADFLTKLESAINDMRSKSNVVTNVIIKDILHPLSPILDDAEQMLKLMYAMRYLSRKLEKGIMMISYDCDMLLHHDDLRSHLYHIADCVVSFYSYPTGENRARGYKDTDGTLKYVKVPKINSFGFHFQQDISDYGYRMTRNHRFFVVDELSLPPCDDEDPEDKIKKRDVSDVTGFHGEVSPLKQVGPLEDFKEVATALSKQL